MLFQSQLQESFILEQPKISDLSFFIKASSDLPTPTNPPTIESSVNGREITANTNLPSSTIQMTEAHNDKPVHFSTRIGKETVLPTSVTHLTTTRKMDAASQDLDFHDHFTSY